MKGRRMNVCKGEEGERESGGLGGAEERGSTEQYRDLS